VDVETAIAAAKAAFPAWSRSSIQLRHDALKRIGDEILARKEELGRLLAREEGKTLAEGIGETVRAGQIFLFFSGEALRMAGEKLASVRPGIDVEITREPLGVIGLITPWNFPIAIPAWKIAPALAYGNCVVLKPAELVPATAHALAEIIARAGLPAGVFTLVMGRGSVVGEAMLRHKDVVGISFTGSVATGRRIAATCIEKRAVSPPSATNCCPVMKAESDEASHSARLAMSAGWPVRPRGWIETSRARAAAGSAMLSR
jgi:alpha-ketoglutaric semialdehyde dehydrogenase